LLLVAGGGGRRWQEATTAIDDGNGGRVCQWEFSSDRTATSGGVAATNSGGAAMDNVVFYILSVHSLTRTTLRRSGTKKTRG
jgi:hypothetical protein